jgi:hypothetical protein
MSLLKNPILLAIVTSVVVFILMSYLYIEKDDEKTKTKNDKKQKKGKQSCKETAIITAAIAGLAVWYLASTYLGDVAPIDDQDNQLEKIGGADKNSRVQISQNIKQYDGIKTNNIPHISSDDPTRSYNLIGSGLNIPRSELKIPNVLIDYK